MESGVWALTGVVAGGLLTGLLNLIQQRRTFQQEREMYLLKHSGVEIVRHLLRTTLEHSSFVERSFDALRKPIGGYTDEEIRKFLHDVGPRRRVRPDGSEWWYLLERGEERIEGLRGREEKNS